MNIRGHFKTKITQAKPNGIYTQYHVCNVNDLVLSSCQIAHVLVYPSSSDTRYPVWACYRLCLYGIISALSCVSWNLKWMLP